MLWRWGCVPDPWYFSVTLTSGQDIIGCRRNITRYSGLDTTFSSTREYKLLDLLIQALEKNDLEGFTSAVVEYDQIMKLDNWKTAILLKIKKGISDEPSML